MLRVMDTTGTARRQVDPLVLAMTVLVLVDVVAVRGRRRAAAVAAGLLAAACLVSVASGFFDGGLGNDRLSGVLVVYQALLLAVTGVVGVLALLRAVRLVRRAPQTR